MKNIKLVELVDFRNRGIEGIYNVDYFIENFNYFEVIGFSLYGVMLFMGEIVAKVEITEEEIKESLETYLKYIQPIMKGLSEKIIENQGRYNEYLEVLRTLQEVKI